jgi:L-ribulokinase
MAKYALGLDYGTESARALLVDCVTGAEAATAVAPYPCGVIDQTLPGSGRRLPTDWALQDADDYLKVLKDLVPRVLREGRVSPEDVIGIGVDFTSCTVVACKADGTPLSRLPEFQEEPHAWVKLWKHHGAEPEAERINEAAEQRGEAFLKNYGGRTSSEWLFAKIWQMLDEAPRLYEATECFVECGDWLVWQLTGVLSRSACQAGYKGLWSGESGFPSSEFLSSLDPRLADVVETKLPGEVRPIGARAGVLSSEGARLTGLREGTPVAVSIIDAHAAVPAATITRPGQMLMILGTSACHMALGEEARTFPGLAGVVKDGILPGFHGYEAGQPATGDLFGWFARHCAPRSLFQDAEVRGASLHAVLEERASKLAPGASGLLALDWWNGNRSVLMDSDLSGLILGLTLDTRPEEIYRALIEGSAFGTRIIIERFEENGIPVEELYACGGLAENNHLLVQVYADVTGKPIRLARSALASAVGAAMLGAVAAGKAVGGHESLADAAAAMGGVKERVYEPSAEHKPVYDALYAEWRTVHDAFAGNGVMKRLKALKLTARGA